jgi:hypothetical protein
METSNEWIIERTGIEARRWVVEGETGETLATAASKQALERAGVSARDIELWMRNRLQWLHLRDNRRAFNRSCKLSGRSDQRRRHTRTLTGEGRLTDGTER